MVSINTLEHIYRLITDRIEEDLTLEYKKELGGSSDMAKEVCALADGEGGTLIS